MTMNRRQKIVITGPRGYVASELSNHIQSKGHVVIGLNIDYTSAESSPEKPNRIDITDRDDIRTALSRIRPDIVIHTAALSNLNQCQTNQELAFQVNVEGTRNIIQWIQDNDQKIKLVFMSSDYVFDGEKGDYTEDDVTDPSTFYGKTKNISENDITTGLENYIICRSAAIYGRGGNFFNFVFDAITREQEFEVFSDVQFTPTYIDYFLDCLEKLIELDFRGLIHVAGREKVSRYQFAAQLAEVLGKSTDSLKPATQPPGGLISKDSSLNSEYARKLLGNYSPTIEKSFSYCFGNLIAPYFYFADERGALRGLTQGRTWEEVNHVESVAGSTRGNHYHKDTTEGFFIISGSVKIFLLNIPDNSKTEFKVGAGDFFIVQPNVLHTFEVLEDAQWINMLSKAMDNADNDIHRL
ncbi:MAG: sugar nucleotide-binding protein [Dehalococcoidales bacterium]|nr:sugar nucleotide-binding protein [Dehalococcoidales bacterium]